MNDDELNGIIARSEDESRIFHEMDMKRERDALEAWRNSGNRGKPPPPLIQLEELPECYQTDEPFDVKEVDDVIEGRGQRRRNVVSYNDGLSDDAWALVSFDARFTIPSVRVLADTMHDFRLSREVKIYRSYRNVRGRRRNDESTTNSSRKQRLLEGVHRYRMSIVVVVSRPRRGRIRWMNRMLGTRGNVAKNRCL